MDHKESEFDLSLRTSWSGPFWIFFLKLLLDLPVGLVVKGQASFEDHSIHVHLDGSAEDVRLAGVSNDVRWLGIGTRDTSVSLSRPAL
jgi:hypothetical protein